MCRSTGLRILCRFWGSFCCRGVRIWKGSSRKVLLENERTAQVHSVGVVGFPGDYIPSPVSFIAAAMHMHEVPKVLFM